MLARMDIQSDAVSFWAFAEARSDFRSKSVSGHVHPISPMNPHKCRWCRLHPRCLSTISSVICSSDFSFKSAEMDWVKVVPEPMMMWMPVFLEIRARDLGDRPSPMFAHLHHRVAAGQFERP